MPLRHRRTTGGVKCTEGRVPAGPSRHWPSWRYPGRTAGWCPVRPQRPPSCRPSARGTPATQHRGCILAHVQLSRRGQCRRAQRDISQRRQRVAGSRSLRRQRLHAVLGRQTQKSASGCGEAPDMWDAALPDAYLYGCQTVECQRFANGHLRSLRQTLQRHGRPSLNMCA